MLAELQGTLIEVIVKTVSTIEKCVEGGKYDSEQCIRRGKALRHGEKLYTVRKSVYTAKSVYGRKQFIGLFRKEIYNEGQN